MIASSVLDRKICYPDDREFFSPSEKFPEYQFSHVADKINYVYRAVRCCLANANLDVSNYDTQAWNPLGEYICRGSNVFVLCNFVSHKRISEEPADFLAKCTHGSLLRAVLDYVLIAAGKEGIIRFGNAAIQSCRWDRVLLETGASKVAEFYRMTDNQNIMSCDLRSYITRTFPIGSLKLIRDMGKQDEIEIDLGQDSLLEDLYSSTKKPKFRIGDYDPHETSCFHKSGKHVYVINKRILEADVIINLSKLKTHEKAGVTLGIKCCVGGIARKQCLAHFRLGSPKMGGDEYRDGQIANIIESKLGESANRSGLSIKGNILRIGLVLLRKYMKYFLKRSVGGAWSGNDTTWRMSLDISRILMYADILGTLGRCRQRKTLSFIDGIIAGEGDGPLKPEAKPLGYLSFCDDLAANDYIAIYIMGLKPERFHMISRAFFLSKYPLTDVKTSDITFNMNGITYHHNDLKSLESAPFKLPAGWKEERT